MVGTQVEQIAMGDGLVITGLNFGPLGPLYHA